MNVQTAEVVLLVFPFNKQPPHPPVQQEVQQEPSPGRGRCHINGSDVATRPRLAALNSPTTNLWREGGSEYSCNCPCPDCVQFFRR